MVSVYLKFIGLRVARTRHTALEIREFPESLAPSHYYKKATKAIKVVTLAFKGLFIVIKVFR